jgi:hypothetical protein
LSEREIHRLLALDGTTWASLDPPGGEGTEELRAEVADLRAEVAALREEVQRSATPNGKTERQRAAEARLGQTLEEFFAAHADASVSDLARELGTSKSTAHAWREAFGPG